MKVSCREPKETILPMVKTGIYRFFSKIPGYTFFSGMSYYLILVVVRISCQLNIFLYDATGCFDPVFHTKSARHFWQVQHVLFIHTIRFVSRIIPGFVSVYAARCLVYHYESFTGIWRTPQIYSVDTLRPGRPMHTNQRRNLVLIF